ncbi:TonB-dependent receptor plug domain-containing protein [Granulicella sp. WH15]|uniref:TonB-dependent receptor n=1 Tax=Granulicella sp. WH15 TaxID=2602070 RepID=UPI0013A5AE4A|nr:TonB-dependent receptor plug domain-containing protein [Granulicella sp. WH15]
MGGRTVKAMTDDRGLYKVTNLEPGAAQLIFEAPDMERFSTAISLHEGENSFDEHLAVSPLNSSVVVTAQKRDEELEQTPVSIDLITGNQAERDGIHELGDLNGKVSNFLYSNTGSRGVFSIFIMRGFANNANSIDPSTAFYVDGIPVNDFFTLDQQLIDIDHIEVLKGPQGALYGASSEAGVINIISKAPTNEYHGTVTGSYASYNGYQTGVSVSGPAIKDRLLFAVSGAVDGRDAFVTGYVDGKGINTQSSRFGRARLDWIPQEKWRFSAVIDGTHVADGGSYVLIPTDLTQFNQTVLAGLPPLQPYQEPVDTDGSSGLGTNSESLQSFYSGNSFNFTALVARREALAHYVQDADLSPVPFYVNDFRFRHPAWNEEFRFQSPDKSKKWIWTVGASFLNDTRHNQDLLNISPANPYGYPASTLSYGDPLMTSFIPAVFGQVSTRRFHERLGITAGFREEWLGRSLLRQPNPNGITYNGSIHDSIPLPSFIADYRVRPNLFVYYSLGRGWVPGGQNIYATTLDTALYKRQSSLSNEIGIKTTQFHDTLAINADIFHNGVQNYQDTVYAGILTSYFGNAARAHMNGAELEAGWQPVHQVKFDANVGLISARYDDYVVNPSTNLNLNNSRIHSVPGTTTTLSVQYSPYHGFFLKGEWNEVGSRIEYDLTSSISAVPYRFGGYGIFNLQAGIDHNRWSTLVFANNLGDRLYFPWITVGTNDGTGYQGGIGIPGMRRQIGFRTALRF